MAQICNVNSGILVFSFHRVFSDSTEEMTPEDNQAINCQLYSVFSFKEVIEDILLLVAHHIAPDIVLKSLEKCLNSGLNVVSVPEHILAVPGQDSLGDVEGEVGGEVLHPSQAEKPQRPHGQSFHHSRAREEREEREDISELSLPVYVFKMCPDLALSLSSEEPSCTNDQLSQSSAGHSQSSPSVN